MTSTHKDRVGFLSLSHVPRVRGGARDREERASARLQAAWAQTIALLSAPPPPPDLAEFNLLKGSKNKAVPKSMFWKVLCLGFSTKRAFSGADKQELAQKNRRTRAS